MMGKSIAERVCVVGGLRSTVALSAGPMPRGPHVALLIGGVVYRGEDCLYVEASLEAWKQHHSDDSLVRALEVLESIQYLWKCGKTDGFRGDYFSRLFGKRR